MENIDPKTIADSRATTLVGGLWITLHSALDDMQNDWRDLAAQGLTTLYQSYGWCHSWCATIGKSRGIKPAIIQGRYQNGKTAFILPFQIHRRFGVRHLEWLTQPDANYGYGIFARDFTAPAWFDDHLEKMLALLPHHDVRNLQNMPETFGGFENPLRCLLRSRAANQSYVTAIDEKFETLHARKRTAKSRSKIRRRDERLTELGTVAFEIGDTCEKASAWLSESFGHKNLQLKERGIRTAFVAPTSVFLDIFSRQDVDPHSLLKVFRLSIDGETVSSLVGGIFKNQFCLMILSLAPTAPKPFSPGDYLLRKVIAWACAQGLESFDFSNGDAGYKRQWADDIVALYHCFQAASWRGAGPALALTGFQTAKRHIKNNERLFHLFNQLRQVLKGSS